jgi:uncharacterized repeat protein (TIGR03803 family)
MRNATACLVGRISLFATVAMCLFNVPSVSAQTFSMLYAFTGKSDGASPRAGLVADSAGNLYGTTYEGGDLSACNKLGCGVVFKLSASGSYSVLHTFPENLLDGLGPYAALALTAAGTYMGTATGGGAENNGAIFTIDTTGNEKLVHSFALLDGQTPEAGLTRGSGGNFYGTATAGGGIRNSFCDQNCGVVFKTRASGALTVLHDFAGGSDGITPQAGVAVDAVGNVYGTTITGGTGPCTFGGPGCGIVYKIDPAGAETILHTFVLTDGATPLGQLVLDSAGNLYGTTYSGGEFNFGEVYKIDSSGNFLILYNFTGGADGSQPSAGVVLDNANNIYGTTSGGGTKSICAFGCGVVFRMDSAGAYQVLHRFNFTDGFFPEAPLLIRGGAVYGTTPAGATAGVIFKVVP